MSEDEPPRKKQKEYPLPPSGPIKGGEIGEGISVVAAKCENDRSHKHTSAFRKRLQRFDFKLDDKEPDLKKYLEDFQNEFEQILKDNFKENKGIKVYLFLTVS